jgi:adenosine deaminase
MIAFLLCLTAAHAQPAPARKAATVGAASSSQARAERAFEQARDRGPLALYAFLYGMPKGGDLHNHLSGAIYAESWIRAAGEDHLCVDVNTHSFVRPEGTLTGAQPVHCEPSPAAIVEDGRFPAASLAKNQPLYDALVDAFSMRTFVPRTGESGHDHFFDTFDKFGGTSKSHMAEWLDEIASRAAAQNEQYLELMHTPPFAGAAKIVLGIRFTPDYARDRQKSLDGGLRDEIPAIKAEMDGYDTSFAALDHCAMPDAKPACQVAIRYVYQVLRNFPPPVVFAQILLGFEVAAADPKHFVAINLVQPEDDFYAMRDYHAQMQMIEALKPFYPSVHVTLHAGELAPGLVPPEGLTFHIRDAVETAGAERIGHGVDVLYETHPNELLKEMATRHVAVEINLTSNEGILNVSGGNHPLPYYLEAGVPVALSTDDEGVSRSNMTHEYTKAAAIYGLSYLQLKDIARNSLTFSFLPGESLWPVTNAKAMYREPVAACRVSLARPSKGPDGACSAFLGKNAKAAAQWEMEKRFAAFEAEF